MVSTGSEALGEQPAAATTAAPVRPVARLNARISAYLVDSIVLVAFILVFLVIGGAILLFTSDFGEGDAPDWAYYACVFVFLGGSLLSWSMFNVALMRWRSQTTGMYVIGIRMEAEDGTLTTGRVLLRWFGLHPLLFHPLLLPVWVVTSLVLVSITLSQLLLGVTIAVMLLCITAPLAGLIAMLTDPERRALHDRLSGTLVVHIEQP